MLLIHATGGHLIAENSSRSRQRSSGAVFGARTKPELKTQAEKRRGLSGQASPRHLYRPSGTAHRYLAVVCRCCGLLGMTSWICQGDYHYAPKIAGIDDRVAPSSRKGTRICYLRLRPACSGGKPELVMLNGRFTG
jgi:hypothetical protein